MSDAPDLLLLVHVAATWYMVGLCWLIQRVQYPLMASVGRESFVAYEQGHTDRIRAVVVPVMLVEVATALTLFFRGGSPAERIEFQVGLALLAAIWLSAFLIQVPLHAKLTTAFDARAHAELVRSNWIRTLAWSARGLLLLHLLWAG